MALTKNALSKQFRAGKTFWRCLPTTDARWATNPRFVDIQEVCLQGKKELREYGTVKIVGVPNGRGWNTGDYYLGDLAGHNVAMCFDTRRKAERFKAQFEAGGFPELTARVKEREAEMRDWDEMYKDYDYDDSYSYPPTSEAECV